MKYLDICIRAASEADFWPAAIFLGIAELDADGVAVEVAAANIVALPPIQKSGTTPPAYWPNFHANIRVDLRVLPDFGAVIGQWAMSGIGTAPHSAEFSVAMSGSFPSVELVENINTPVTVWA